MEGIILIGLQASGKSSFYLRNFFRTHVRVSLDMLKTRHREEIILNACLESKQPIVIDNTNPTSNGRQKYIGKLKQYRFAVKGYYFQSKLEECLERNCKRSDDERIPEIGIRGTYNKIEIPKIGEGFDCLFYVAMTRNNFNVQDWDDEI